MILLKRTILLFFMAGYVAQPTHGEQNTCKVDKQFVDLLAHHNTARQHGVNCGHSKQVPVAALTWHCDLAIAATEHAKDMSKNNFLRHIGSNGMSFSERVSQTGFNWSAVGENIASGYISALDANTGWLESRNHCLNIMNPDYEYMAAARIGKHWAVVFAR